MTFSRPLRAMLPIREENARAFDARVGPASTESVGEADLVFRIRAGDAAAFDALAVEHFNGMMRYAASLVSSLDEADDVVQTVLVRLWRYRTSWSVRTSIRTYLLSSVRNEALSRLRSLRSQGRAQATVAHEATIRQAVESGGLDDAVGDRLDFVKAVRALPARRQEAVVLRFYCGMTIPQVAVVMGVTPKAAELLVVRAIETLRRRLKMG